MSQAAAVRGGIAAGHGGEDPPPLRGVHGSGVLHQRGQGPPPLRLPHPHPRPGWVEGRFYFQQEINMMVDFIFIKKKNSI